jgi:hypothetical protein
MRDVVWPVLALGAALVAVVAAALTGPLAVAVALATLVVAIAVVYLYTYTPKPREEEIPLEDFSWWADIGEPFSGLKVLEPAELAAAAQLVASDLKTLQKNSGLLNQRLSLLVGRREFEEFPGELVTSETQHTTNTLGEFVRRCEQTGNLEPELYKSLERSASRLDRVANKLFEFERGRSEVVKTYVDPLRRASEKLSKDLRKAASNLYKFEKRRKGAG